MAKLARLSFRAKDKLRVSDFTLGAILHGSTNGSNPIVCGKTMMDTPGMQGSLDNLVDWHEFHGKVGRRPRPRTVTWVVVGRRRRVGVGVGGRGMLHFLFTRIRKSSVNVFSCL